MKKKIKDESIGPILYSRHGDEEGVLLEGSNGEVIAWFYEDSNNLVSGDTLMRWAKQAQTYARALKVLEKKPAIKVKASPAGKKKAVSSGKKKV